MKVTKPRNKPRVPIGSTSAGTGGRAYPQGTTSRLPAVRSSERANLRRSVDGWPVVR